MRPPGRPVTATDDQLTVRRRNPVADPARGRAGKDPLSALADGTAATTRYRSTGTRWRHPLGRVFNAVDNSTGDRVVVTLLHKASNLTNAHVAASRATANVLSGLSKPYINGIVDVIRYPDDRIALVTQHLSASVLSEQLGKRAMPVSRALAILRQLARALAETHRVGISHGALCAASVLLTSSAGRPDMVMLTDFGLQGIVDAEIDVPNDDAGYQPVTPERILGLPRSEREDIYLLGSLAYTMLTGSPPFRTGSSTAVQRRHAIEDPMPIEERLRGRRLPPPGLVAIVHRCLAKEQDERFADMADLEAELCLAQIQAGVTTAWDDLPIPAVDDERKQKILRGLQGRASSRSPNLATPEVVEVAESRPIDLGRLDVAPAAPTPGVPAPLGATGTRRLDLRRPPTPKAKAGAPRAARHQGTRPIDFRKDIPSIAPSKVPPPGAPKRAVEADSEPITVANQKAMDRDAIAAAFERQSKKASPTGLGAKPKAKVRRPPSFPSKGGTAAPQAPAPPPKVRPQTPHRATGVTRPPSFPEKPAAPVGAVTEGKPPVRARTPDIEPVTEVSPTAAPRIPVASSQTMPAPPLASATPTVLGAPLPSSTPTAAAPLLPSSTPTAPGDAATALANAVADAQDQLEAGVPSPIAPSDSAFEAPSAPRASPLGNVPDPLIDAPAAKPPIRVAVTAPSPIVDPLASKAPPVRGLTQPAPAVTPATDADPLAAAAGTAGSIGVPAPIEDPQPVLAGDTAAAPVPGQQEAPAPAVAAEHVVAAPAVIVAPAPAPAPAPAAIPQPVAAAPIPVAPTPAPAPAPAAQSNAWASSSASNFDDLDFKPKKPWGVYIGLVLVSLAAGVGITIALRPPTPDPAPKVAAVESGDTKTSVAEGKEAPPSDPPPSEDPAGAETGEDSSAPADADDTIDVAPPEPTPKTKTPKTKTPKTKTPKPKTPKAKTPKTKTPRAEKPPRSTDDSGGGSSSVPNGSASELASAGNKAFNSGKYKSAVSYLEKAVKKAPANAGYRLSLGDALYKQGRYAAAKKQYTRAQELGHGAATRRLDKVEAKLAG